MNIEELKKENSELKKKLSIARLWMEREVRTQVKKIAKIKVSKMTSKTKDAFFWENIEEIITKKISEYFWEIMLINIPYTVTQNIIAAEISYFNLKENPNSDWLWVITSYHKALDTLIENFITKWFRKFAKKKWQVWLRKNDSLEKSLNSVVNTNYILSVWRLYHLITVIQEDGELYDYWKCFKEYLDKYSHISEILFDKEFLSNFKKLIDSEILGKKRHIWKISFDETKHARKLLIWDFKDVNSLIFKFMEIVKVEY